MKNGGHQPLSNNENTKKLFIASYVGVRKRHDPVTKLLGEVYTGEKKVKKVWQL